MITSNWAITRSIKIGIRISVTMSVVGLSMILNGSFGKSPGQPPWQQSVGHGRTLGPLRTPQNWYFLVSVTSE